MLTRKRGEKRKGGGGGAEKREGEVLKKQKTKENKVMQSYQGFWGGFAGVPPPSGLQEHKDRITKTNKGSPSSS